MKQFFLPLKVFFSGMIVLGLLMWFWPFTVDQPTANLAGNTTAWGAQSDTWGWSWLMSTGVVRWLAFVVGFLCVCWATGVTFVKQKTQF